MAIKTGYPLVLQDHGLVSALGTLSKHYAEDNNNNTHYLINEWDNMKILLYKQMLKD